MSSTPPTTEPLIASQAVLTPSCKIAEDTPKVTGYDFNNGINYDEILKSFLTSGFQATNFGNAVEEINKMVMYLVVIYFTNNLYVYK